MTPSAAIPENPVKLFQIRWKEKLGRPECPYLHRWVFVAFGFAIRVHHWIRSDDKRFKHNHPWSYLTFVLKGGYTDVFDAYGEERRQTLKTFSLAYRPKTHTHYVEVPKGGCWTVLLTPPPSQKWGFFVNGVFRRPIKFFRRYGHPACSEQ
jgi:hypothetical protein